jgi:hypothetical protein
MNVAIKLDFVYLRRLKIAFDLLTERDMMKLKIEQT